MFAESASLQDQNASHTGAPGTLSWSVLNCNTVRLHEKQEKVLFLNQKYIFISIFLKRMGRGGGGIKLVPVAITTIILMVILIMITLITIIITIIIIIMIIIMIIIIIVIIIIIKTFISCKFIIALSNRPFEQ